MSLAGRPQATHAHPTTQTIVHYYVHLIPAMLIGKGNGTSRQGARHRGQGQGEREEQALATSRLSVTTAKEYKAFSCPPLTGSLHLPIRFLPLLFLQNVFCSKKDILGNSSLLVGPRIRHRSTLPSIQLPVFVTAVLHDLHHPAVAQYLHLKAWDISPTPSTSSVPWKRNTYILSTGFRHRHHPAFTAAFPSTAWSKICGLEAKKTVVYRTLS